jgi:hypothetical protein
MKGRSTDEIIRFCGKSMALKRLVLFDLVAANWEHAPGYCCLIGDQPA